MKVRLNLDELPTEIKPTEDEFMIFIRNCSSDFRTERGCINWKGNKEISELGGNKFRINGKKFRVQKLILSWFTGKEVKRKKKITIRCGNKWCINPRHMRLSGELETLKDREKFNLKLEKIKEQIKQHEKPIETKKVIKKELFGDDIRQRNSFFLENH
jgi:hypothetical protein